jgi:hypothetical protein
MNVWMEQQIREQVVTKDYFVPCRLTRAWRPVECLKPEEWPRYTMNGVQAERDGRTARV